MADPPAVIISGLVSGSTYALLALGHSRNVLFVALVITSGLGLLIHAAIFAIRGTRPMPFPALVSGTVTVVGVKLA